MVHADGVLYWADTTQTLSAIVNAFPPAVALLMHGSGSLLHQLVPVYSGLVPDLQRALPAAPSQTDEALSQVLRGPMHELKAYQFCLVEVSRSLDRLSYKVRSFSNSLWKPKQLRASPSR